VARCLIASGELYGDEDDVWTHHVAYRALATWRLCMEAISMLVRGKHAVQASYIKGIVMQEDGLADRPIFLDDIAEWMVEDAEARLYWQSLAPDERFPHRCPHCGSAAYVGFLQVSCKARCPSSKTR
jgi:hypothetical protein